MGSVVKGAGEVEVVPGAARVGVWNNTSCRHAESGEIIDLETSATSEQVSHDSLAFTFRQA